MGVSLGRLLASLAASGLRSHPVPLRRRTLGETMTETLMSLAGRIRGGEQSPLEAVDAALAAIEATDGELNAFCEVRADDARAQARAVGRAARARRARRRAGRSADRREGPRERDRIPHDLRRPGPRIRPSGDARLGRGGAAAGRGCGRRRQDEHPGLRLPRRDGQSRLRCDAQPVGARPYRGRLERWFRGRGRERHGDPRDRLRRWRVDPYPVGDLRHLRLQADARSGTRRR